MNSYRLHGYWRSSATWRVRIGLALKKIPYELHPVNLIENGGEQKKETHLARNPMGQVPVLEVLTIEQSSYLTQSLAILLYLEEIFPEPPILPADALQRAKCFAFAEMINSGIQPLQNLEVNKRIEQLGGDVVAWNQRILRDGLASLETLSPENGFSFGNTPTIADICLIPQLYNARRWKVDLSAYPRLCSIERTCMNLTAFADTRPELQPDAPKES